MRKAELRKRVTLGAVAAVIVAASLLTVFKVPAPSCVPYAPFSTAPSWKPSL